MTARERILSIKILEKAAKHPEFAKRIRMKAAMTRKKV